MLNYTSVVFDFGNVIGRFDEDAILSRFCPDKADYSIMKKAIFHDWEALDAGTVDYDVYVYDTLHMVPDRLKESVKHFFREWYKYLTPIEPTWQLIRQLKAMQVPIYLLSNAPTYFAEYAPAFYEILNEFDGIVFSAPLILAKPDPRFYEYLFHTYNLNPKKCLFIDDKPINVETSQTLGMDGIIFTGDIDAVRFRLGFPADSASK